MPERRVCESQITAVTVYARGAVVTRTITLNSLPDEPADLVVEGVTPFASPGSFRTGPIDGREVLGVTSELSLPESRRALPELAEKLKKAERELEALRCLLDEARSRRELVADVSVDVGVYPRSQRWDMTRRLQDGLAVSELVDELTVELDERIGGLEEEITDQERAVLALQVEQAQVSTASRTDGHEPTRTLTIRLSSVRELSSAKTESTANEHDVDTGGSGQAETLAVSYVVAFARWWPAYTIRVHQGNGESARNDSRVDLQMEAFVAQLSGEDWSQARIELATADLNREIQLPELPSWRLGRKQPVKSKGFRPPPDNLERLFSGYDRLQERRETISDDTGSDIVSPALREKSETTGFALDTLEPEGSRREHADLKRKKRAAPQAPPPVQPAMEEAAAPAMGYHADGVAHSSTSAQGVPPPQMMMTARRKGGGLGSAVAAVVGAPVAAAAGAVQMLASRASGPGGGGYGGLADQDVTGPLEPSEGWLDFDRLKLAGPDEGRRGRLMQQGQAVAGAGERLSRLENLEAPRFATEPSARGEFDHLYAGEARVDVPSDGELHRIPVLKASTDFTPRFRTVPVVSSEVFREITCQNPLPGPILRGPADVFAGGAMLTTANLEPVDKGGTLRVGLGVEERIRVSRNVKAREDETGVFVSKSVVNHQVEIELASALGHVARVEVLDRIPHTYDDEVSVTLEDESPVSTELDEYVGGHNVRGGRLWELDVPAGGTRRIEYRYQIKLSAKREIVGGNRRD